MTKANQDEQDQEQLDFNTPLQDKPNIGNQTAYWKSTLRLTASLLMIWFLVSFGAGILFRDTLDQFYIGGAPLGFWFAQNGAIYVFLILIIIYCIRMTQLEKKYGIKG